MTKSVGLFQAEKAAKAKDNSDAQRVDDFAVLGLEPVIIDDGFNEDSGHSDHELDRQPPRVIKEANRRRDADEDPNILDQDSSEEEAEIETVNANAVLSLSDEEF